MFVELKNCKGVYTMLWVVLMLKILTVGEIEANKFNPASRGLPKDTNMSVIWNAWKIMEDQTERWANDAVAAVRPTIDTWFQNNNISEECVQSVHQVMDGFRKMDTWAWKMVDSSAKFVPNGFLQGTFTEYGSYDECLSIDATTSFSADDENEADRHGTSLNLKGQYCMIELRPLLPQRPAYHSLRQHLNQLASSVSTPGKVFRAIATNAHFYYYTPLKLGICIPSTCVKEDLETILKTAVKSLKLVSSVLRCEISISEPLRPEQTISIATFSILIILVILGTVIDVWYSSKDRKEVPTSLLKVAIAFSAWQNMKKILDISTRTEGDLRVIHGIRVLTMAWIILGHTYVFANFDIYANTFKIETMSSSFLSQGIFNATLTVDTFYFISGLLTTYIGWKYMSKGQFSIPGFLLLRYLRLTPTVILCILLMFLLRMMGSGPIWKEIMDPLAENCRKNWWTNVLYVNNIIDPANICLLQTWFLAVDTQLHVLSLIVVIPLIRSVKFGLIMNWILLLGSTGVCIVLIVINKYPPTSIPSQPEIQERWQYVLDYFYKPFPHIPVFCIGLMAGLILASNKMPKLSKMHLILGWSVFVVSLLTILYAIYPWSNGVVPLPAVSALYASTHRTIWAVGLAWIVLLCSSGQGGPITQILSWRGFIPLSRLTFVVYMIHPNLVWASIALQRERVYPTHYLAMYIFVGHSISGYIISFILAPFLESPFIRFQKILAEHIFPNEIKTISNGNKIETIYPLEDQVQLHHYEDESNNKRQTENGNHAKTQMV